MFYLFSFILRLKAISLHNCPTITSFAQLLPDYGSIGSIGSIRTNTFFVISY